MFITTYFFLIESTLDNFNGTLFIKLVTNILSKKTFDSYWKKSDFIIMVVIFVFSSSSFFISSLSILFNFFLYHFTFNRIKYFLVYKIATGYIIYIPNYLPSSHLLTIKISMSYHIGTMR